MRRVTSLQGCLFLTKTGRSVYKEEGDHREIWRGIKFSQVKASKWLGKASGKVGGGAKKTRAQRRGWNRKRHRKTGLPPPLFCRENTSRLNGARYSLLFLLISFSVARTKTDCHAVNLVSFASIRLLFSFHS